MIICVALAGIYSVFWLGKAAIDSIKFKDKEAASKDIFCWKLSAGNLLIAAVLVEINSYLINGGFDRSLQWAIERIGSGN